MHGPDSRVGMNGHILHSPAEGNAAFELERYRHRNRVSRRLLCAFLAWLTVFGTGMAIPSKPFRDLLVSSCFDLSEKRPPQPVVRATPIATVIANLLVPRTTTAGSDTSASPAEKRTLSRAEFALLAIPLLVIVLMTFTPTNLLLLTVFGALLGAYVSQRRSLDAKVANRQDHSSAAVPQDTGQVYATTAIVSGMCVFLGVAAGFIVIQGEVKWDVDRPDLYLRLSAFATLFAIVSGWNPMFLHDLTAGLRKPWGAGSSQTTTAASTVAVTQGAGGATPLQRTEVAATTVIEMKQPNVPSGKVDEGSRLDPGRRAQDG